MLFEVWSLFQVSLGVRECVAFRSVSPKQLDRTNRCTHPRQCECTTTTAPCQVDAQSRATLLSAVVVYWSSQRFSGPVWMWTRCWPGWRMIVLDTYDRTTIGPMTSRSVESTYSYLAKHNPNDLKAAHGWFNGARSSAVHHA